MKLLSLCWLSWQPAWQNVVEKNWKRHLLDFYLGDKPAKRKKIPYISTKSCNFVLYFGKRWLTGLSLSCTTLVIAYFNLTTLFTCYCIRHSGIKPFDLCMALERYWLCYSTTNQPTKNQNTCRYQTFWLQDVSPLFSQWFNFQTGDEAKILSRACMSIQLWYYSVDMKHTVAKTVCLGGYCHG